MSPLTLRIYPLSPGLPRRWQLGQEGELLSQSVLQAYLMRGLLVRVECPFTHIHSFSCHKCEFLLLMYFITVRLALIHLLGVIPHRKIHLRLMALPHKKMLED